MVLFLEGRDGLHMIGEFGMVRGAQVSGKNVGMYFD
jgi:hypothetical protein